MKTNNISCVLLIILFSRTLLAFVCENEIQSTPNSCYATAGIIENDEIESSSRSVEISWAKVNEVEGTVDVHIDLNLSKKYEEYEISLTVNENVKHEDNCNRDVVEAHMYHTYITYNVYYKKPENVILASCNKTATFTFKYIFTGCYKIDVVPKIGSNSQWPEDSIKFLKTKYKKTSVEIPGVSQQYRFSDSVSFITIVSPYLPSLTQLDLTLRNNTENGPVVADYTLIRSANKFEICRMESNEHTENEDTECVFVKQDLQSENTVECRIKNIREGTYYLVISFLDPVRCTSRSTALWGSCKWYKHINCTEKVRLVPEESKPLAGEAFNSVPIICGLIAFLVILIIIGLLRWKHLKSISSMSNSLVSQRDSKMSEETFKIKPQILLLYARDSPLFMEVMSALRDLIANVGQCEVLDIYDDLMFDEIAEDPEGWIRDKLHNDNCKTTLILTYCGFLQTGIPYNNSPMYKEQNCFDMLFPYAMRQLIEIKNLHSYTKLFVANLSFDRNDYESCNILNPFTRYGVPSNLDSLLSDLLCWNVEHSQFINSYEYAVLSEKYKNFETYCKENPEYIKDILRVEFRREE